MAHAEKRDGKLTGHWYGEVDQRYKGGLRFRARFETKRAAEGYEAYIKATGEAPPWLAEDGVGGCTFKAVADDCKANYAPWKQGKDRSVLQRLEFACGTKLGSMPITAITRTHLEALVADLKSRPGNKGKMAGSTVNRYLTAVSTVLTYASKDAGKYGKVSQVAIPWQGEGDRREETLSYEQEDAVCRVIAEAGYPTYAFLVRVLAASGMRLGELMGLKPEQIEHERVRLKAADVKTKAARLVYIGEDMARELRALVAAGGLPDPSHLRKKFKDAVKVCGYASELCLHSLRHTRATRLLESGVDPQVTMQMMGWSNFNTMQRYRHVNDDLQREAAKKVSHHRGELGKSSVVVPFAAVVKAS